MQIQMVCRWYLLCVYLPLKQSLKILVNFVYAAKIWISILTQTGWQTSSSAENWAESHSAVAPSTQSLWPLCWWFLKTTKCQFHKWIRLNFLLKSVGKNWQKSFYQEFPRGMKMCIVAGKTITIFKSMFKLFKLIF